MIDLELFFENSGEWSIEIAFQDIINNTEGEYFLEESGGQSFFAFDYVDNVNPDILIVIDEAILQGSMTHNLVSTNKIIAGTFNGIAPGGEVISGSFNF